MHAADGSRKNMHMAELTTQGGEKNKSGVHIFRGIRQGLKTGDNDPAMDAGLMKKSGCRPPALPSTNTVPRGSSRVTSPLPGNGAHCQPAGRAQRY
jgi:hypothetical protein